MSFVRGPIADAGNEAMIAEILIENRRGVFGGHFGQDIYEGAHAYGFRVVPGGFLDYFCVRLRASSLDCRTAGVLSISQFGHLTE
jgi:hypothetical protein